MLGVPCPYPNYDIVFVPDLAALAYTVPGLMLVNERLLARMNDPGDGFAAMVCAHEVAHLWFGSLVGKRWWDDLWLGEALATYLSYEAEDAALGLAGPWTAFCYRDKERAYRSGGVAVLDDLVGCLSAASGHDLAAWAGEWLRTAGASTCGPRSPRRRTARSGRWPCSRTRRGPT
jgi:aminopeptidase N